MISVYKGKIKIKKFEGYPHSGIEGDYFYTPLKKLKNNTYWVKYYRKGTQYYDVSSIKKIEKYCDVEYYIIKNENDGKTSLIYSTEKILYGKETILIKCNSKQDKSYIGCPENTFKLINDKGITEFWSGSESINIAQIGRNPKKNIWYLWDKKNIHELKLNKNKIYTIEEIREYIKPYIATQEYKKEYRNGFKNEKNRDIYCEAK